MTAMSPARSYVCAVSDQPMLYRTIGQTLDMAAQKWGSHEALVARHQGVRLTYRELNERAETLAAGLLALGLFPGDRVGIWAPNCLEWALTQYATAKAGLILVNINPGYRLRELEYALNKVGCKALVTASTFKSSDYLAILTELAPEMHRHDIGALEAPRIPTVRMIITLEPVTLRCAIHLEAVASLATDLHRARLREVSSTLQADDPINIQFTSGTTGAPKGATLTHFNILNNGAAVGAAIRLSTADRLCIPVPLYHCFGMVAGNLGCLTHGATAIYPGDSFTPQTVLETVSAERCTALYGVPTMFTAILEHPELHRFDLSSLRTGILAGAPCPITVMRRVVSQLNMREVTIAYGMTETSPVTFQSDVNDPLELRISTVGRIQPHLEAKIVDEHGRIVPRGVGGDLCTRGYAVMPGYWNDPEKTDEVIDAAGWMHTGDRAVLDEQGYCNIVGRSKDMVIRGGENLYPREIEEFLFTHPKIQTVACFGVPDSKFGEELCAWIQLRADLQCSAEEIQHYCKERIAHYKIPRYICFVDSFPMTVTGKIQKFVMRERMIQRLGLQIEPTA